MVFQRSVGQPLASVVKTLAVNCQNRQTFWAKIHQLGPKMTHGHLRLHKNSGTTPWSLAVDHDEPNPKKRLWRIEISIFLDRNVVRIRSSIVSNLSKINQIFNLSPNQERFVSLTIWVSTLFLPSNQSHHLACDTDEILFWQTRFLGIYRSWERSENLMAPGGTGFEIKNRDYKSLEIIFKIQRTV